MNAETCYGAMVARDRRFDGLFYVGVKTTGIYCRPICPVRLPAAANCTFFRCAAEAEKHGFRACLRCRPELAPGRASVDARADLAERAARQIDAGYLDAHSVEALSDRLGASARHVRRALEAELGVTPVEFAQTRRLAIAKRLLHDTTLPLVEVAAASGFASLRRFNAAFAERFGRPPSALRRDAGRYVGHADAIVLRLDYRPPMDWGDTLAFLAGRAIPDLEHIDPARGTYTRRLGGGGEVHVAAHAREPYLIAHVSLDRVGPLGALTQRLRSLFDLDMRPDVIAAQLGRDPRLAQSVALRPGLRVPGAFDGFETAVRAVLGQQVSVAAATTLARRLVARHGRFPDADTLAASPLAEVRAIGLPTKRAETLLGLARAVADGRIDLTGAGAGGDPEATIARLVELPGFGPWTANYLAMRALHWPNAFPAADLGVKKALGLTRPRDILARAERWAPWRAYAVMHLWRSLGDPS